MPHLISFTPSRLQVCNRLDFNRLHTYNFTGYNVSTEFFIILGERGCADEAAGGEAGADVAAEASDDNGADAGGGGKSDLHH